MKTIGSAGSKDGNRNGEEPKGIKGVRERPGRSRAPLMDSVTTATPVQKPEGPGSDAQHQSWPGNPVLTPTWDQTKYHSLLKS
ncbi:hypothetical protein CEXT_435371 [Caerostris extrusa]|uniref:Uncharacterized protein n=1 Tax=Caerostris extrusa TaxID=172846 RepID=A0AAV4SM95_CAEEX|nr:hypothetical protein CEXT_435371 [Caerostris extrusa]